MMKRKFALFLAAAMVAASAPTNVFAAISNNYLSKSGLSVPNYTLFYEDGVATGSTGGAVTGNEEKIEYWINGSNLIIELTNNVSNGMTGSGTFKVELENAKWFFRNNTEKTLNYQLDAGGTQEISEAVAERLKSANYDGIAYDASTKTITGTSKVNTDNYFGTTLPAESTFDVTKGVYADRKYFRLNKATPSEVPYMMQISSADDASATVVILGDTEAATSDTAKRRIVIPLVVRSTGSGEVRVSITDSGTSVATNSFLLAQGAAARTRTIIDSVVTSRTDFKLEALAIKEQRIGSIKPGASFELIAPSGYYFGSLNNVQIYVDLGLTWASGYAGLGSNKTVDTDGNPLTPDYTIGYRTRNNRQDSSVVEVKLIGNKPSTNVVGGITLKNLVLISEDDDRIVSGQDLNIEIRDLNRGSESERSITDESVLVARVSDYAVNMKRVVDKIPELVSGRLDAYTTFTSGNTTGNQYGFSGSLSDSNHKAAVVRVEEAIPNAWWAGRTTEFSLPEGVKIIKAEFTNVENITEAGELRGSNRYFNTGVRENGLVTIRHNRISISRLNLTDVNKKARFDLALWLSIEPTFEGDIDLTLSGSAVINANENNSITIAKALRPVNVTTTVSDIKVGYQYISVGDFEITETKAGNLEQGKSVYVSVTDEISVDMSIAKGFNAQVSEGNLRISNIMTGSALGYAGETIEGQVKFDIDRASTQASTISFTNVQVKVDRSVPYSNLSNENDRGINLVVWGPAIAQNYEGLIGSIRDQLAKTEALNTRDFFPTPGIRAKYINVTTAATGENNQFANVVRVTIGNPVIKISGQDYTMPVAAYVSTASNSTMVPVRFVANALGLDESKVKWDDATKTVTVDAGTRIVQFQIGNTSYVANGVSVPMTSPDGRAVAAEITNERAFVPFRALGDAFNITVTWEEATSTAIYNAPVQQ